MGDGLEVQRAETCCYIRQMRDVCLIQTNTSGVGGNRGFIWAAKFLSIFIHNLDRKTPLLHPQSTPVPGRLFIQDCRRGKEECFAGVQRTRLMTGATFLTFTSKYTSHNTSTGEFVSMLLLFSKIAAL